MSKLLLIILALTLSLTTTFSESFEASRLNPTKVQEYISDAQDQRNMNEPALIEQATYVLRQTWKDKVYADYGTSEHGYLMIVHTQVTYIKEDVATRELTGKTGDDLFHNVFCVIDFMLLSDYFGSAPYYFDAGVYSSVIVYLDGTLEAVNTSPFKKYISYTYNTDLSDLIDSVHDCGSDYNAAYNLLD